LSCNIVTAAGPTFFLAYAREGLYMTFPKGQKYESEKRPYSFVGGCKAGGNKFHNIPHLEVNHWFRTWGIIGEKRDSRQNTTNP